MMKIRFFEAAYGRPFFMRTSANQRYNQLLSLLLVALPVIGGGNYEMHNDPHSPGLIYLNCYRAGGVETHRWAQ